jgi:transcription termination/antitermination protein NusA
VDSVGACVGMKGMRVQSIIRELRGEKIDIIEYSDDPVVFATHALSPAKISRVSILDAQERHMEVIVDDSQLSLAIGKKGQNVRLAAKLLNWKIDIKSEEEKRQEVESAMAALVAPGAPVSVLIDYALPEKLAERLLESGVGTIEKLGQMTPEQLEEIQGIGPKMVERIQEAVNAYYAQYEEVAAPVAAEEALDSAGLEMATPAEPGELPPPAETQPAEPETVEGVDLGVAEELPTQEAAPPEGGAVVEEIPVEAEGVESIEPESDTIKDSKPEASREGEVSGTREG